MTTTTLPTKCAHGGHKICKHCSAYRMVFLLKHGNDHLKSTMPDGTKVNPVRYSYVSKNRKGIGYNINGMMRRFQNDPLMDNARIIRFYENFKGGALVAETAY